MQYDKKNQLRVERFSYYFIQSQIESCQQFFLNRYGDQGFLAFYCFFTRHYNKTDVGKNLIDQPPNCFKAQIFLKLNKPRKTEKRQ